MLAGKDESRTQGGWFADAVGCLVGTINHRFRVVVVEVLVDTKLAQFPVFVQYRRAP